MRDFALCLLLLLRVFTVAALARSPDILEGWLAQLFRFVPWLLIWLAFGLVLGLPAAACPQRAVQRHVLLAHKAGNAAIAALVALGFMWLFPGTRSAESQAV